MDFAYRQHGPDDGVPLILLNHLSAVLDNWDPRVVDGLAARRRVITYDNRGVGASGGSTPDTIEAMARDTVLFIRAVGYDRVDLLGLSMGGFVAQVVAAQEPDLVRKMILAGTGPAGGPGIDKVTSLTIKDILKAVATRRDPEQFLFFTATESGRRAAHAFLDRLKERTDDRDKAISLSSFRAQLKAIHRWGVAARTWLPPAAGACGRPGSRWPPGPAPARAAPYPVRQQRPSALARPAWSAVSAGPRQPPWPG
ncbi:alpha/beta fold hydrolase [Streptomyces sp. Rer75]|uniref:alpha/beta fold hydrolase n=1 Tax=Streptomyces sp. Rer75 TaxID=2750011 RepID=UPI00211EB0B4|nr:alpha/beta hydrolase [Streptomyces sp. Rer75]